MADVGGIVDNVFNIFSAIKREVWRVIQIPFRWWFGLPDWVHYIALGVLGLFALIVGIIAWKKRNDWRHVYNI
jgi:uncharacterized iron-regulated membrane protein